MSSCFIYTRFIAKYHSRFKRDIYECCGYSCRSFVDVQMAAYTMTCAMHKAFTCTPQELSCKNIKLDSPCSLGEYLSGQGQVSLQDKGVIPFLFLCRIGSE